MVCALALDFYWLYVVSRWSLMTFDACVRDSYLSPKHTTTQIVSLNLSVCLLDKAHFI